MDNRTFIIKIIDHLQYLLWQLFTDVELFRTCNYYVPKLVNKGIHVPLTIIEENILNELCDLYVNLKQLTVQKRKNEEEKLSPMWATQVYQKGLNLVMNAIEKNDKIYLKYLLNNFWCIEDGLIGATYIKPAKKYVSILREAYNLYQMYTLFRRITGDTYDRAAVINSIGNPFGFRIGDKIINGISIRHSLDAFQINRLAGKGGIVLEIGGGHGSLASHCITRDNSLCYVDCDLPEMLLVAYYYLKLSLPETSIIFISSESMAKNIRLKPNTIILLPSIWKRALQGLRVDVVYNSYSLSEMSRQDIQKYLEIIASCCQKYFLHENYYNPLSLSDGTCIDGREFVPAGFKEIFHSLPNNQLSHNCMRVLLRKM